MTRCRICDWSPSAPQSDYYLGSVTKSRSRKLLLDNETNDTICTSCAVVISLNIASFGPVKDTPDKTSDPMRTYDAWAKDSEGNPQSWEEYMEKKS